MHVCRRWRQVIFASPHRLDLQILCTYGTPVRKSLGIWPAFPIILDYHYVSSITPYDEDNAIDALEHPDRVCTVRLYVTGSQLGKMATVMLVPFPVLTRLDIRLFSSWDGNAPVLPADFLGGSAPCLQEITLSGIPSPALGKLLLSTNVLVKLDLLDVPSTGYISPEVMIAGLAALPRLESFAIGLQPAPLPVADRIRPPPVTRIALPALTSFYFKGASEYLEDLVAQIDNPQLNCIEIEYLNQLVDFRVPQLSKFIDRSMGPRLTRLRCADVRIRSNKVTFTLYCRANYQGWDRSPWTTISYEVFDWHVSHMAQVLSQFSATLSNVVHLKLEGNQVDREGTDGVEWLYLLHQFSTVRTLYIPWTFARHVALALEDITVEMATEVLSTLDLIYLEAPRRPQPASSVEKFVAVRRLSGRPVTVVDTKTEFHERLESYVATRENVLYQLRTLYPGVYSSTVLIILCRI